MSNSFSYRTHLPFDSKLQRYRSFYLKNRENDVSFYVELLHIKKASFSLAFGSSGMGGFAGGGSHFSSGARFGNRPGFARGPGICLAFAFRQHDGRFCDRDRFFHRRFSRDRFFFGFGNPYPWYPYPWYPYP
jgi:hypothetical protein